MEVFKRTVSAVFAGERRYVIPLFQRPYVWTREGQWEPLWDDIAQRADRELEKPDADEPAHFLGAIVIQQRPSWGDQLLAHDVIDGQQRLTTFQILLHALRDVATTLDPGLVRPVQAWLRNANPIENVEIEQFKLWPTGRDVAQYVAVTAAGSMQELEKAHPPMYVRRKLQPRPRMVEAYCYFFGAIDAWARLAGMEHAAERLKALRRVFDRRMQLVSIELQKDEDPQVIFETLNARGVPLLASDLLRNFIFQRAGSPAEAERLHQRYWKRFELPDDPEVPDGARFWEVEERQGRLFRARLDLFVQHYLSMKLGSETLSSQLFQRYKDWQRKAPFGSIEDELRDLTGYADHFMGLMRPTSATRLGTFATRLRALDTSTVYPFLLGLLNNQGVDAKERDKILVDLESFLVRRLICGKTTKNYNHLFLQLARDFGPTSQVTHAAFHGALASGGRDSSGWPSDDEFRVAWMSIDAYTSLKPARVEMILQALDQQLRTAATEAIVIQSHLTIEHVMPQQWEAHWPLPAGSTDEERACREAAIQGFGNLTMLTGTLNSKVSNGPAATKLHAITQSTALRLNAYFQRRDTWSEDDIRTRCSELCELAMRVWPGP